MSPETLRNQIEAQILTSYRALYRLAFTYVKNPDDAMDVVQESVCKALSTACPLENPGAVKSWLCRIAVNTALDLLRRQGREVATEEVPERGREDRYQDVDTLRALDALDPRERTIVVLRFFEDQRLQDIADGTGENLNTVKTILYRSLKKMRVQLEEGDALWKETG